MDHVFLDSCALLLYFIPISQFFYLHSFGSVVCTSLINLVAASTKLLLKVVANGTQFVEVSFVFRHPISHCFASLRNMLGKV